MKQRIGDHARGALYMADLGFAGILLWNRFPDFWPVALLFAIATGFVIAESY